MILCVWKAKFIITKKKKKKIKNLNRFFFSTFFKITKHELNFEWRIPAKINEIFFINGEWNVEHKERDGEVIHIYKHLYLCVTLFASFISMYTILLLYCLSKYYSQCSFNIYIINIILLSLFFKYKWFGIKIWTSDLKNICKC